MTTFLAFNLMLLTLAGVLLISSFVRGLLDLAELNRRAGLHQSRRQAVPDEQAWTNRAAAVNREPKKKRLLTAFPGGPGRHFIPSSMLSGT